jgi:hypothetical protein
MLLGRLYDFQLLALIVAIILRAVRELARHASKWSKLAWQQLTEKGRRTTPVSPSVVAAILMTQKPSTTSGTFAKGEPECGANR